MNLLCLEEGSEVIIRNVNLKKGTYIKFQPHKTEFIDIPGFKEM
jgi:ubiquitin fusion degradation protein 1